MVDGPCAKSKNKFIGSLIPHTELNLHVGCDFFQIYAKYMYHFNSLNARFATLTAHSNNVQKMSDERQSLRCCLVYSAL